MNKYNKKSPKEVFIIPFGYDDDDEPLFTINGVGKAVERTSLVASVRYIREDVVEEMIKKHDDEKYNKEHYGESCCYGISDW